MRATLSVCLAAVAVLCGACGESAGPWPGAPRTPRFEGPRLDVMADQNNAALGYNGTSMIKGFNPTNPQVGDAIVVTFYWTGTSNTITAVTDSVATGGQRTYVGNTYHLVEYTAAGSLSIATYLATNVQGFPGGYSGSDSILAIGATFSEPFTDGGMTLSAYSGVAADYASALAAHQSASDSASSTATVGPGAMLVNSGDLVYAIALGGPPAGVDRPAGFTWISSSPSDNSMATDGEYQVAAGDGSVNPQWTWYFSAPSVWLATELALNPAGSGNGIVFESDWSTATGRGSNAVTDGGRWPHYDEFNGGGSDTLLSVVAGIGPSGHNALRVLQRGDLLSARVQVDNLVPQSTDYYVRYYMMNEDTSSSGDHIVTVDTYQYPNLTYVRKSSHPQGWNFVIGVYGCGYNYPVGYWGPDQNSFDVDTLPQPMSLGTWYRFEYYVHFTDANHIQVHPRVYDANGTLLYSDADFQQTDYGSSGDWNGSQTWTLASYYAAGYDFCVDPTYMSNFSMGNNGQQGAVDTGLPWYFAGVEIRSDTWPGPIQ